MTKDIDWEKVSVAANRLTWVINDAAYKAPEIREVIGCNLRLMDAVAALVELTGYGQTKEECGTRPSEVATASQPTWAARSSK